MTQAIRGWQGSQAYSVWRLLTRARRRGRIRQRANFQPAWIVGSGAGPLFLGLIVLRAQSYLQSGA